MLMLEFDRKLSHTDSCFYLVKCVSNDLNVHLIQVLLRNAVLEKCS